MTFARLFLFFFFSVSMLSNSAFAGEALFGPEFNFSNNKIYQVAKNERIANPGATQTINSRFNEEARDKFAERVRAKCPECRVEEATDRYDVKIYVVTHPNGWTFNIALDPAVVEIQTSPMTVAQINKEKGELQRLIFDTAKEIGLRPQWSNPGHLHIGVLTAFGDNILLFRNFIVDTILHSKMMFNMFNGNVTNSPTVDQIGENSEANLRGIVKAFDESGIWKPKRGVARFRAAMNDFWYSLRYNEKSRGFDDVFKRTPRAWAFMEMAHAITNYVYFQSLAREIQTAKFQFLNITRMFLPRRDQTLELRGVREFESIDEYLTFTTMVQARLDYLETKQEPIPFAPFRVFQSEGEEAEVFHDYVAESGGPWPAAGRLMSPEHQKQAHEILRTCSDMFARKK